MPRILVTRPRDDAELTARKLRALGYETLIEPLLVLEKTGQPPPDWRGAQAVLATSAHAFDFLPPDASCRDLACYCVGARTASAARQAGFARVIDAGGDGAALAGAVAASLDRNRGGLLYLAARDTDGDMENRLTQSGFSLLAWVLYAAETAPDFSPAALRALGGNQLDAVLVFSARTAAALEKLIVKHGLEPACETMIALGISAAVRQRLETLRWRCLDAAASPTEDAVLQRLQAILPLIRGCLHDRSGHHRP